MMQLVAVFALFATLAALEWAAFTGLRFACGAGTRRRSWRVAAGIYWAVTALVLGALVVPLFGPSGAEGEAPIPQPVLVAAAAVYLPKVNLALATVLEFARRAGGRLHGLLRGRTGEARPGWLTRARVVPRFGLGLALVTLAAVVWGATRGRTAVAIYSHVAPVASLPSGLDGLRVVHLSDIHASSLGSSGLELANRVVAAVNAQQPDVVVFTGDYGEPADFESGPEILGRLNARLGKFAVLGNHDFGGRENASDNWTSPDHKRRKIAALQAAFASRGFRLLVNEAVTVSRKGDRVSVLGVGVFDPHHGFHDADLASAERSARAGGFRLLLTHSPEFWEQFVKSRRPVAVTFAGHTHGAQVGVGIRPLVWSPAALQFRQWGGLYRTGRQLVNVNRGIGYVGLPFRLNMPADVSVIILRSGAGLRDAPASAGAHNSALRGPSPKSMLGSPLPLPAPASRNAPAH